MKYFFILFSIIISIEVLAQEEAGNNRWVDYAFGEYEAFPNITYATGNGTELKLDLYLPGKREKPLPTLLLFHGGGWVNGKKERNVLELLPYLSMGWAVINVEYRLAGNSLAPAAVEDCRCALRWTYYNAAKYNFDTTKIVLTGGSAGGHLALITGMLPHYSKFDRVCYTTDDVRWVNLSEPDVKVAAIVNFFGITDVADLLEGENAKHYAIEWFGSMDNRIELAAELSPVNYVDKNTPPIITIHGDKDGVVPLEHAVRLHKKLDEAGVQNQLITVEGGGHGRFGKEIMLKSHKAIREFLKKLNINNEN